MADQPPADSAELVVISADSEGVITNFNSAAERALGYTSEECIGKLTPLAFRDSKEITERAAVLTLELRTSIKAGFETLVALARRGISERSMWTFVRKDGSRYAALVSTIARRDAEGNFAGAVELISDLTDRRPVEQTVHDSEERYRALYADIPSMYFTVDPVGTVLSVNAFGASQLGYTEDELIGCPVLGVLPLPEGLEAQRHLAECVANPGEVFSRESRLIRKDGSLLDVKVTSRAVRDQQGSYVVLVVWEDITERHVLQGQLAMAQKMEAIGRLAGRSRPRLQQAPDRHPRLC